MIFIIRHTHHRQVHVGKYSYANRLSEGKSLVWSTQTHTCTLPNGLPQESRAHMHTHTPYETVKKQSPVKSTNKPCLPDCHKAITSQETDTHTVCLPPVRSTHAHTHTHTLPSGLAHMHTHCCPTAIAGQENTNKPCLPDCHKAIAGQEYTETQTNPAYQTATRQSPVRST